MPPPASFWCLLFITPWKGNFRQLNDLRESHRTNRCSLNTFVCFALAACIEYAATGGGPFDPCKETHMASGSRLLAEQRRRKILEFIEHKGQITVRELASRFSVSAVTARGDLDALCSENLAI